MNDPDYYEELYAGAGKKRDKYIYYTEQFGNPKSMIGTVPHNLHRIRRAPLNRFFSKQSVTRLEPLIQHTVDTLCSRLREFQGTGKPLTISLAYACFTNDVVTEYAFGRSYNYLKNSPDFHTELHDAMVNVSEAGHVLKVMPWLITSMQKVPPKIMKFLRPKLTVFLDFQRDIADQIKQIMMGKNESYKFVSHPTIFHDLLDSDLPPEEKALDRLWQEGQTVVGAGTETTAWTLTVVTYHLLANPEKLARLRKELSSVMTSPDVKPSWNTLEKLPYLSACISEGLRLSFGVSTHLQRVSPDTVLTYLNWAIPPGTPVGMTSVLIHLNPSIFPVPKEFRPERWLENPRLERYLVSFSKGSRQCLGMNLAYAELFLCLANVVGRFEGMELYETGKDDVEIQADNYVPKAKEGSLGVRVVIR